METIAVTGSTGFVGRAVVRALLDNHYRVCPLVRHGSVAKLPTHINLEVIEGSPLNADDVEKLLHGASALIHLVGTRRAEMKRTGQTYADVDLGSVRVAIDAMNRAGVKRILLLSAASIGNSEYVRTKKEAEHLVQTSGLEWTIFRPSFILGKGQQWPIILSPLLSLLAKFPGRFGDIAARAQNITRDQLAHVMISSLRNKAVIGNILDVPAIRSL